MVVEGSLVWVQRKNGTWWPGRVVPHAEISPLAAAHRHITASPLRRPSSSSSTSPSNSKTPVMLLGKENHSVDWYNLEKSKRIKAFRCGEFDGCIKQVESSQASAYAEDMKYVHRKDAILHALSLERKEQQKKLKRAGEVQAEKVFRAKRSRCTYLPIQTESSKVSTSRVESDESTSSKTEPHPSVKLIVSPLRNTGKRQLRSMKIKEQDRPGNSSKSPECKIDEVVIRKEMQKGKSSVSTLRGSPSTDGKRFVLKNCTRRTNQFAANASSRDIGCASETMSGVNGYGEAYQTRLKVSNLKDSDAASFDSACTVQQNGMDMMLIDVDLTVQRSSGGEHVPFICLVSRMSQKAIIGYPINIEVLQDSSEVFLLRKDSLLKRLFEDGRDRVNQLTWKTSRRTPVCYISNSQYYPAPENGKSPPAIQSFSALMPKGNRFSLAMESSGKLMKKQTSSDGKKSARAIKHKGSGSESRLTCVPVNHVFSKLFSALGKF